MIALPDREQDKAQLFSTPSASDWSSAQRWTFNNPENALNSGTKHDLIDDSRAVGVLNS